MVIRNIGPRTETEVWEIGVETGVEYPKKLGLDIADGVVLIYQIIHRLHKHRIYLDRLWTALDRLWTALDHLWIVLDRLTSSPPNYHSKVFFLMILRRFQPLAFTQVYNILCTCAYFIYIASPE